MFAPEIQRRSEMCAAPASSQNLSEQGEQSTVCVPNHTIGSTLRGSGFHQNFPRMGVYHYNPNRANPNDSAAVISEEALMQMLIILQGKVLDLKPYSFWAPVPRNWLFGILLVSAHCREHQSGLEIRPSQTFWRDLWALTASAQSTDGPGKGGDERDHS